MEQPWSTLQFLPHRKGLAACRKPVGDGQQPLPGSNWGLFMETEQSQETLNSCSMSRNIP